MNIAPIPSFPPPTSILPSTVSRVEAHTSDHVNARIDAELAERVARISAGGLDLIDRRLEELDREWDIERALEANAASVMLAAVGLAITVNRRWIALAGFVGAFLLQHAVQGWCPPMPVMRRLGFRTQREINIERTALRLLRDDFREPAHGAREAVERARAGFPSAR